MVFLTKKSSTRSRALILFMALLVCMFLLAIPVGAQETAGPDAAATAAVQQDVDAPVILAVATEEDAGPVAIDMGSGSGDVTINTGNTNPSPVTTTPAEVPDTSFLSNIISAIVGAIVGGIGALAGAASWIRAAMNDPVKMTLAESAASSIPKETHRQAMDMLQTAMDFLKEATDGVPMVTKPRASQVASDPQSSMAGMPRVINPDGSNGPLLDETSAG